MQTFMTILFILLSVIAMFLTLLGIKYFLHMTDYKNRKKDGSEDDKFKKFD
ncbi:MULTISPECIES: hypothetical protein [Arcobacteraceae]|uniref:Uncharacterized protein n=2 Tax=Aliarcobacter thereius TaxID=544718 RepID=A0A1C0BAC0_9BACT|nr:MULTISPECIES: hypothetical protein [Arcobacteraceae]OCL84847.1 hypothetical protein AAW29_00526 [Arcobacter porcinus]OCL88329.1 hypothetical protein AAX26_00009 [Aliarcobacter thereius]OCL91819.1 hypothetical protein AAX25_00544 [Aliarcobacter thereius]OCL95083.1 hypothetical protein AA347_00529 [Aliarcobacter thereius LMG 24486]OCM00535.1 hypothetical protein AAX29_00539 [Aliarcobacter thereius]